MSVFADYVFVASQTPTLDGKFELAAFEKYIDPEMDRWILNDTDQVFGMCDFIAPGGFPAFLKSEDAAAAHALVADKVTFHMRLRQREGVSYAYLD